ncbi:MAG: TetR/AcrR family transcriptional regulator [Acidimicrobiia bacterium]|nr:TetR/AcrR family transcriptional regulator [Acidimicrobiia bacterium]
MSLRQAKKEKTSKAILEAASARFATDGIEAARMDDIAADAEVAVGTLYNYFGSKQSLLIALFEAEVREMLAAGRAAVSHDVDPVEAVRHLFAAYLDIMLATDRNLLREVLRFSLWGGEAIQELARLDEELMTQLAGVLSVHQESGRLDSSLAVEDAVFVLYSVLIAELIIYLSLEGVAPGAVHANVGRRVRLVFDGLNP